MSATAVRNQHVTDMSVLGASCASLKHESQMYGCVIHV